MQGQRPQQRRPAAPRASASAAPAADGPSHSINSMVAAAVWWVVNKYSAAFLSWMGRFLYGIYCNWLIGGATGFWGNVKWFFVCMKAEEDVSNYAYSNSQQILSILTAGGAYWLTNRLQRFWYRASSLAHAGANIIEQDLARRLDSIQGHLEQMSVAQQELRASVGGGSPPLTPLRASQEDPPSLVATSPRSSASQSGGGYNLRKSAKK